MDGWTLCFLLLLPLTVCFSSDVTLVKNLGSKPDVTPICTNKTLVSLVVCTITRQRSRREECHLLYSHEKGFENTCDSRFTLMTENQTVFLHLTSLTPEESGNYTCQCSSLNGTYILHFNVTVEDVSDGEDTSKNEDMSILPPLIGVTIFIVMTTVILGFLHRRLSHGGRLEALSTQPSREPENIEPYSTFIVRDNGLYSTAKLTSSNDITNNSNKFTK